MQHPERLLFITLLSLLFSFCNNPTDKSGGNKKNAADTAADTAAFSQERDTLVGFKGMERCGYKRTGAGQHEFVYRHYTVKTTDLKDEAGQSVSVINNETQNGYGIPSGLNGFFAGIANDILFVDRGTGPDMREMILFNLKTSKPVHKATYVGEPEVLDNGKMWYLRPADEKEITKLPDCPDRAEWEKNGLSVGYGQVCVYSLTGNTEVKKSEWRCVVRQ